RTLAGARAPPSPVRGGFARSHVRNNLTRRANRGPYRGWYCTAGRSPIPCSVVLPPGGFGEGPVLHHPEGGVPGAGGVHEVTVPQNGSGDAARRFHQPFP